MVVIVNNYEPEVLEGAVETLKRTKCVIYQSIHHKKIANFLERQSFELVESNYAGPPGEDDEYVALFRNVSLTND